MDLNQLPEETERSIARLDKADLRKELKTGWGATTGGQAITRRYHERLAEGFRVALLGARKGQRDWAEAELVVLLRGLSPGILALSSLQTLLHSIGQRHRLRDTLLDLGGAISDQCWAAELTSKNGTLAARIALKARTHGGTARRFKAARKTVERVQANVHSDDAEARKTAATLVGFKERNWNRPSLMTAGAWLFNVVSTSLPEVFERVEIAGSTEQAVTISPAAWGIVDEALARTIDNTPVFWPSTVMPKPWDAFTGGGSHDERVNKHVTVVRTYHRDTQSAVKHAIKSGVMKPALDALNALQSVPFTINTRVLEVIEVCEGLRLPVKGLVPERLDVPAKPSAFEWADMTEAQQRLWKTKRGEVVKTNNGFIGDRVLFDIDMQTAQAMSRHERFYTPMNLDWRGRVYALCSFNFQREDRVRSLFLFADGMPIGDEGLRWLMIHTANTGDFRQGTLSNSGQKISKRPLEERVQWCISNRQQITNIASAPLVHTEWMGADKPFLHLAACFELSAAWEQGSSYVTRLPTSYDGSCSGLQHLCGMTRADEGSMVNLTSSPLPEDVYQRVSDDTYEQIERDLLHEPEEDTEEARKASADIRALAQLFLDYDGDRRKMAKRNVMTYSYSSKKFGMSGQQQVDLMEPLAREVLEGKRSEHPFEGYQHGPYDKRGIQQPSKAARYIAGRVFDAIELRIKKPAEAMKFLQSIAKAMAHEGKPVRWTTPVGLPWINRYHAPDMVRLSLYLVDGGVKERLQCNIATGTQKEIDKAKAANGVAPNFVHALDASHLLLVANAAALQGITSVATVHDSFGCLAPQASTFNRVIREEFARMYETHDVLADILKQASCDLTDANRNKLPTMPQRGDLNLKDIINADFAFA